MDWLLHPKRDQKMLDRFCTRLHAVRNATVIEMGAKRSNPANSTLHRTWAAEDAEFTGTDFENGIDVDVVADAHSLSLSFKPGSVDAVISVSVFEHLQRPWIAAMEIGKVLKPGGIVFVYTHFAFPIHGFPSDYYRFTREGLETIFTDAGLTVLGLDYENPCQIFSEADPNTQNLEAFTGVRLYAEKPARP
jgi:predicted SAM-dependent methyltransferase